MPKLVKQKRNPKFQNLDMIKSKLVSDIEADGLGLTVFWVFGALAFSILFHQFREFRASDLLRISKIRI